MQTNTKTKTVYLSGKMSGLVDHGFPAFNAAAKVLREQGYFVINPAETENGDISKTWEYYMRLDIKSVTECDLVVVLPGWETSKGANYEILVAHMLGVPVLSFPDMATITNLPKIQMAEDPKYYKGDPDILETAKNLVRGDRNKDYGSCITDFNRIAMIWTALWSKKLKDNEKIAPEEVGWAMVGLKMSRDTNRSKFDNRLDAVGYLLCVDDILRSSDK